MYNFSLLRKSAMFIIAALMLVGVNNLHSQPTNYCNPCDATPPGSYSYTYFCIVGVNTTFPYGWVTNVALRETASNTLVFENRTNGWNVPNCTFYNTPREVILGTQYSLNVEVAMYYEIYGYPYYYYRMCRVYIDWNQDGDFVDAGETIYSGYAYSIGNVRQNFNMNFTVPNTATPGLTRMRVIGSYYIYNYGPCFHGYLWNYPPYYYYQYICYGESEDYLLDITSGVKDTYPSQDDILFANESYNGVGRTKDGTYYPFSKPQMIFTGNQKAGQKATFKIIGPLPSQDVVYEGLDPVTGSNEIDVANQGSTYTLRAARGTYADGNDGSFKSSRGGTYRVFAYTIGSPREKVNTFFVSWDNDIACNGIISPKTNEDPQFFKYLAGQTFRVTGLFQNVGLRDITSFRAYARFYKPNGDFLFEDIINYNSPPSTVLRPGDKVELDFPTKRFNDVGIYSMEMNVELLSADDQDSYNDSIPRSDWPKYTIEISHEIQLQAHNVLRPAQGEVILGNRPLIPWAEFKNVGIGDASFVPARLTIRKLPNRDVKFTSSVIVQDLQAGKYNTKTVEFDQMTIKEDGDYEAEIIITAIEDVVRQDDTLRTTFSVVGGLNGSYTIGTLNAGNNRNFASIDSAMNALYYRGIAGPVTFELTDAVYNISSKFVTHPAWDFSSRIIGSGWDADNNRFNTITWKPSRDRSRNRASVTINLYSASGVGVKFGQSTVPSNEYAIFHQFGTPENANSEGHIIFDGGTQKSFKFVLHSRSQVFGSAFYLGQATKNVTVQNCIVDNGTPERACNVWLPAVVYSPPTFTFQPDSMGSGVDKRSYFAGITNRSYLLKFEDVLFMRLDTIPNQNNVIRGNEISKFGYGIVSLGLGTLYKSNEGQFKDYYNTNNKIENNIIRDVCRAGIFLGFEQNSSIKGNRIFNVGNGALDAAGIMAGGNSREGVQGYNNMQLLIDGNEISDIKSPSMVHGIKVEQVQRNYQRPSGGLVYSPSMAEKMVIKNNAVWGLQAMNSGAHIAGIHLFTERNYSVPGGFIDQLLTPLQTGYRMRNDVIANNTVYLTDDAGAYVNSGAVVGIGVQQADNAVLYNNAIAIKDNSIDPNNPVTSAVFYQGQLPKDGGLISDRNAYWLGNSGGTIFRYVETDASNTIVELGDRNEFQTLEQWQIWTGGDPNSVYGDFTRDLAWFGTEVKRLRVNMQPQAPIGSILNNRGNVIEVVTHDIDGNARGVAGQRYDIGAFEFDGRMYTTDLEMLGIPEPGAYKNGTGEFSDAEYIMTKAPVEVRARLRNGGSLQQSDITVLVKIFRETPAGTFGTTPEVETSVKTSIASTESADVFFNLADGSGIDFNPKPYSSLASEGYTVPTQFTTMMANVTPRYKIQVSVDSDEENTNNIATKTVRFYLKRSPLKLLISTEYSFANINFMPNPTVDEVAGRLNADSLLSGMKRLGWATELYKNRFDIDIFDRQGWPTRAVNYTMYRTVMWTDAYQTALNRYQVMDLNAFLESYDGTEKKNLILGSEELVRTHDNPSVPANYRPEFVNLILRSENFNPANPLGNGVSNDGNSVIGRYVGRDLVEEISSTAFDGDMPPYCGLMKVHSEGAGVSNVAYDYVNHDASPNNATMGVATTTLTRNVIHLGVDWRHWKDMERLLRALLDFVENNGGTIVPVELANFDASARGKQVDIVWSTASEIGSSRFEIEKSDLSLSGASQFVKIGEVKAAGTSHSLIEYGPVVDRNVEYGRSYTYRLKMIDLDGQSKFSEERTVTIEVPGGLSIGEAKPNPAVDRVLFDMSKGVEGELEILVYDVKGKTVTAPFKLDGGSLELNVGNLSSGVYTLMVKSGDVVITRQLTVVK